MKDSQTANPITDGLNDGVVVEESQCLGVTPRLSACLRYNAPPAVFLRLPALLAQPLCGAASFCRPNVLQGD